MDRALVLQLLAAPLAQLFLGLKDSGAGLFPDIQVSTCGRHLPRLCTYFTPQNQYRQEYRCGLDSELGNQAGHKLLLKPLHPRQKCWGLLEQ